MPVGKFILPAISQQATIEPTLATFTALNIAATSADVSGEVLSNGGSEVTSRGIVWSTLPNPTLSDNTITDALGGLGLFSATITNLSPDTVYYYRAFAVNVAGTAYGPDAWVRTGYYQASSLLTDLVSDWGFDETTGDILYDAHGVHNGVNTFATVNEPGVVGTSYGFNPANAAVVKVTSDPALRRTSNFTVSLWFKANSIDTTNAIFRNAGGSGYEHGFAVTRNSYNLLRLTYGDGAVNTGGANGASNVGLNWRHLLVIHDGTDLSVYLDNVLEIFFPNAVFAFHPSNAGGYSQNFGDVAGYNDWNGFIDQANYWARPLTEAERAQVFNLYNGIDYSDISANTFIEGDTAMT